MRTPYALLMVGGLLTFQAATSITSVSATAPAKASAKTGSPNQNLKFDINQPGAVELTVAHPDIEGEVLSPLRQAQEAKRLAAAAAQAKARARATYANQRYGARRAVYAAAAVQPRAATTVAATGDAWARLRACESGGRYNANTGNGYYGAYQYNLGTWGNYGGYARPDLAPPAVQDAKAY